MIYILAGIVGMCALICVADLIVKIWDRLDPTEKESAPDAATSEGTIRNNLIFIVNGKERVVK